MKAMKKTNTKTRIIDIATYVAAVNGISRAAAINILTDAFKFISEDLKAGNEVHIQALGKFSPGTQAARTLRNPSTGEPMLVPERRVVRFKPSQALRDGMNETPAEAL